MGKILWLTRCTTLRIDHLGSLPTSLINRCISMCVSSFASLSTGQKGPLIPLRPEIAWINILESIMEGCETSPPEIRWLSSESAFTYAIVMNLSYVQDIHRIDNKIGLTFQLDIIFNYCDLHFNICCYERQLKYLK